MDKKAQIFESIVGWVLLIIAVIVVIMMIYNLLKPAAELSEIECESYEGRCVENENECIGSDMIALAGMGCENYCCISGDIFIE